MIYNELDKTTSKSFSFCSNSNFCSESNCCSESLCCCCYTLCCCCCCCCCCINLWHSPLRWAPLEWIFKILTLAIKAVNWFRFKAFVNKSANWEWILIFINLITSSYTLPLTMWQSISICFVRSWNTGLDPIWIAASLSLNNKATLSCFTFRSFNKYRIQVTSHTAIAIDLYSTSAVDLETVLCFLDFKETNESPRNTQKPVMDLLESGQAT